MSKTLNILANSTKFNSIKNSIYLNFPDTFKNISLLINKTLYRFKDCGYAEISAPYSLERLGNSEPLHYSAVITKSCRMLLETEERDYDIAPETISIIPSSLNRRLSLVKGKSYKHIFFALTPASSKNNIHQKVMTGEFRVFDKLENLIRLYAYFEHGKNGRKDYAAEITAELIKELLNSELTQFDDGINSSERKFEELWREVASKLYKTWTVKELAGKLMVSESQFFALCEKFRNSSPNKIITDMKIRHAKDLLASPENHKLELIAEFLGYSSAAAFSKVFYKNTHERPGFFRSKKAMNNA